MAGINRALGENRHFAKASELTRDNPCIFLSHISVDKTAAREIGNYIMKYGDIDIYLDENDAELQIAVRENDAHRVTQFIERGLSCSTHIMCLVSESTVKSWWVPYELGFAKKAGKYLSTLKLKGKIQLPAYLQISQIILGSKSLNEYLKNARSNIMKATMAVALRETLISHSASPHPLDNNLDWDA